MRRRKDCDRMVERRQDPCSHWRKEELKEAEPTETTSGPPKVTSGKADPLQVGHVIAELPRRRRRVAERFQNLAPDRSLG